MLKIFIPLYFLFMATASFSFSQSVSFGRLTCENAENPEVIDTLVPRLGWQLASSGKDVVQSAYELELRKADDPPVAVPVFSSGKVLSSQSQLVPIPEGLLKKGVKYLWRVRVWDGAGKESGWSEYVSFRTEPESTAADWIGAIRTEDARIPKGKTGIPADAWQKVDPLSKRSILLRKEFAPEKEIREAVLYISGLGHYELTLNGKKVGDSEFAPLWSEYGKTIYYNVYDVGGLLKSGRNALGVMLGNGFYNVQAGRYTKLLGSYGAPTLWMKLMITYEDGTRQEVRSGSDWKYSLGPVVFNCIYGGEDYDASLEQSGWDTPGFDDSKWLPVVRQTPPDGKLVPQTAPACRLARTYPLKSATKLAEGNYIMDMGQNLSGYPRIKVKGKKGQTVKLIPGEKLDEKGRPDQRGTGAGHYFSYTLKGDPEGEAWQPRFNFYGYRYLEVQGASYGESAGNDLPELLEVESCFVYNSLPERSSFSCSNHIFTESHNLLIMNAMRSNIHAVITDCPHREKLGWLAEPQVNAPGLFTNFDMSRYMPKVAQDMADAQRENGLVPDIVPEYVIFDGPFVDSPEWGIASLILPMAYYEYYGDKSLIEKCYPMMKRYVDYLATTAKDHILSHGLGDWLAYGEPGNPQYKPTPIPVCATSHYLYAARLMSRAAQILERMEDFLTYSTLEHKITEAYNKAFFDPATNNYSIGDQYSNAIALYLEIVPEGHEEAVAENLCRDIKRTGCKFTVGDIGNRYLFRVLSLIDQDELAFQMFNSEEAPGYGHQLKCGMTTMTEAWRPQDSPSLNHLAMSPIEEWYFKTLAGINSLSPGMQHLYFKPVPVGDLKWLKASHETLYGKVSVEWKREGEKFSFKAILPVNCDAIVILPDGSARKVGSGEHDFQVSL